MIRTTQNELGEAYNRASREIMNMNPVTPTMAGALWRKHYGLHHCCSKPLFKDMEYWIEFPDDRDYTAFMLRFA